MRCKMLCSEKLPLWKLVNQLVWSPGKLQKRKTSHHISFHFLTISSCLISKLLNTHSGRRHWIRHSQGLWRSFKMDTCWSANNLTRTMYCTKLLNHTYTKIWTLSCGGISEHHGIFLERKNTQTCIKVGCLRPAVTLCLLPFFPPKTDPC